MPYNSPLLDQYNQDGQVTPALQRAMDIARQNIGASTLAGPQIGAAPAPAPGAPTPRLPFGANAAPAQPAGPTPSLAIPQPEAPALQRQPAVAAQPAPLSSLGEHQQNLARITAPFQPRHINQEREAMGPSASPLGPETPVMTTQRVRNPLAHTSADTGRAGIDQIHSPWLRIPLQILEAIGRYKMPQLVGALPGTQLHHNLLVDQERQNVAGLEKGATEEATRKHLGAETENQEAEAEARRNPLPKPEHEITNAFELWHRQNPHGTIEDWNKLSAKEGKPDIHALYAEAVHDALKRGVSPGDDEKVQQLAAAMQETSRTPAPKEPARDDKAIAIYSKPPEKRTAEEIAYLKGYEKYVGMNKTDPGVARMNVLMGGRPVQVVDPDNPENVRWDTAGHAIQTGASTPGSIPFRAAASTTQSFTSGANATVLNNINTAHAHISQLGQIADALKNGDMPILNRVANEYAQQTGRPAPASFQLLKTAVAAEIAKTTHGGVATEKEAEEIGKAINAANSPAQLSGALQAARTLMESKREQLKGQFQQGVQGRPNFEGKESGNPAPSKPKVWNEKTGRFE